MTRFYTGPQPKIISEWSETLNNVAVEEFSSFTGSVTHRLRYGFMKGPSPLI